MEDHERTNLKGMVDDVARVKENDGYMEWDEVGKFWC